MRLIILFAIAITLMASAAPAQSPPTGAAEPIKLAPGFTIRTTPADPVLDIAQIDLEGLKKLVQRDPKDTRLLMINFWATWCDGCREEFPDLVKIDNDYRAKGLNFVAVSLDDVADINTKVVGFLKEVHASMPVVVLNVNDPEPAIHFVDPTWQGEMPATFLYDRDGKVAFKHFGKIKPDELRATLDKQLAVKQ
jgi:thiol-disulfide isomerase/thioredoxin